MLVISYNLDAARESIILAKNERDSLPIKPGRKLLVTGPTCNKLRVLNGGWSYTWQGNDESTFENYGRKKLTIFEAIKQSSPDAVFVEGVNFTSEIDITAAVTAAENVDQIILCIGEDTYTETPGNINNLMLSDSQVNINKYISYIYLSKNSISIFLFIRIKFFFLV